MTAERYTPRVLACDRLAPSRRQSDGRRSILLTIGNDVSMARLTFFVTIKQQSRGVQADIGSRSKICYSHKHSCIAASLFFSGFDVMLCPAWFGLVLREQAPVA